MIESANPAGPEIMPTIQPGSLPPPAIPALLAPLPAALTVPSRFSGDLRDLAQQFADRPARLSEILTATQGRGFNLLLLLIGLPFLTPIAYRNPVAAIRNAINVKQLKYGIIVSFANQKPSEDDVKIINLQGEAIACPMIIAAKSLTVGTKGLATGYFLLSIKDKSAGNNMIRKVFIAQQ